MIDEALLKSALLDAAELLKDKSRWTRGRYSYINGNSCGDTCFCAVGAVEHFLAEMGISKEAFKAYEYCIDDLSREVCGCYLETYNDTFAKDNTDVVNMLQKLAERV